MLVTKLEVFKLWHIKHDNDIGPQGLRLDTSKKLIHYDFNICTTEYASIQV